MVLAMLCCCQCRFSWLFMAASNLPHMLTTLPPHALPHNAPILPLPAGIVETEFFSVRAFGDPEAAKRATSQFKCLEPTDIADAIVWCLSAPAHMEVDDVVVRPTEQMI